MKIITKQLLFRQMYKEINRKGCVYFIRTPLEKLKFVDKTTLKIGHTTNLDIRFKAVNTFIQDEEDYVENNKGLFEKLLDMVKRNWYC